jgi:uncharacterized protein (DUF1786 family)
VWTRALGAANVDCAVVTDALAKLGVQRMVVGHTVQDHGITSACGDAVWRIDVGMSKHYGGPIEVLELVPGAPPKVLHGTRG